MTDAMPARQSCCDVQAKAYTTRVGAGPYPTEISGDLAESLREAGGEYGTTTGRPRRVGWLDIPCLKYATRCRFQLFRRGEEPEGVLTSGVFC